jgi:hypothetical protein
MVPWPYGRSAVSAPLDPTTLREIVRLLDERVRQVETYGAGGCPTCHEAELRAAVARLRALAEDPPV